MSDQQTETQKEQQNETINIIEQDNNIINKKKKSFKDYYGNPDFKNKHLQYIKEKVLCECGKLISRSNLSTHKKSKIHTKRLNENNPELKKTLDEIKQAYINALNDLKNVKK